MLWILLSILAAVFEGIKNLFAKNLTKKHDEYLLAFSTALFLTMILLPYIVFTGVPELGNSFTVSLIITGVINAITLVLILRALRTTELSLVAPIFSLSPALLLLTSPFIIGEFPSRIGLIGVILILIGTYVLNFKDKVDLRPFTEIARNEGQRLIVFVTILWAISSNFYKIGMQNSSPLFFIFSLNLFIIFLLVPFIIKRKQTHLIRKNWKPFLALGALASATAIFQWTAVNLGLVVYALSIKRLSVLISVFGAYILFKEKNTAQRTIATIVMLMGVALITLL